MPLVSTGQRSVAAIFREGLAPVTRLYSATENVADAQLFDTTFASFEPLWDTSYTATQRREVKLTVC
jgi:hypothetical protein